MKNWIITAPLTMNLETVGKARHKGCVKVKISKSAITPADISVFKGKLGKFPIVPCRCAVGFISEADKESGLRVGEKVLISAYASCNECPSCEEGSYSDCENVHVYGTDVDGFLADYVTVPERDVYLLPEQIKDDDALFADYIAIANKTVQNLNIEKGEYVAIAGATILDIVTAQLVIYYQAIPILIDGDEKILETAKNYGIYYTVNSRTQNVTKEISEITGGKMAEHTIYSTDSKEPLRTAFYNSMNGGKVAIIGPDSDEQPLTADLRDIVSRQLTVLGINEGRHDFTSALNILANNAVKISGFITRRANFDKVSNIFDDINKANDDSAHVVIDY